MSLTEFEIIQDYFNRRLNGHADVVLGIGDDAAILEVPADKQLLVSTDTLVSGLHFPDHISPLDLGYRCLAVNLSDLAAMGASPRWATLALTLPEADAVWLQGFSDGFFTLADRHGLALVGGDITRGPLTITVQVHGFAGRGQALCRKGANVGDLVYVTGELGAAGMALACMEHRLDLSAESVNQVARRYLRPEPRLAAGMALVGMASSAIDISDGLLADLGHILKASEVGATLRLDDLPLPSAADEIGRNAAVHYALCSGDDYELCFTVPAVVAPEMEQRLRSLCAVSCIGEISDSNELDCIEAGQTVTITGRGFQHFTAD